MVSQVGAGATCAVSSSHMAYCVVGGLACEVGVAAACKWCFGNARQLRSHQQGTS